MRRFGVDADHIVRGPGRLGVYYVEPGANQRPSKVVYDREYSAIALAKPGSIDWKKALAGVTWFHITGITPAISENAAALSLEAMRAARELGATVSLDLNYRKNLWKWGKKAVGGDAATGATGRRLHRQRRRLPEGVEHSRRYRCRIRQPGAREVCRSWPSGWSRPSPI